MKRQTTWKDLSCDLTPDEVTTYSLELANITIERNEIEAAKKEVVSNYAARINKCNADAAVLSRKVQTRKEDRKVECDLDFDYAKGMVYTVRTDTGVTIGQRKLTDDERQQWLDLDAEEGRRQEAEDRREDTSENIIEGELLQIEHKPEIDICGNTECHYHDATEGNGCKQYEMVWECKQAVQETEEKDCNIKQRNDGSGDFMQKADGVTADRVVTLEVPVSVKQTDIKIHVAEGDSGCWYTSYSFQHVQSGNGYFPYPQFSESYPNRFDAIKAGCDLAFKSAVRLVKDKKSHRIIATDLADFLLTPEVTQS